VADRQGRHAGLTLGHAGNQKCGRSWTEQGDLAGHVALLGLVPGAFTLSGAFRPGPRLASAAFAARLFAWGLAAAFVAVRVSQRFELPGVGQRIFSGTWLAWLICAGLKLWGVERLDGEPRRRHVRRLSRRPSAT
jgi:hypothetical protein